MDEPEANLPKKHRIGIFLAIILSLFAFIGDLFSLIPFVGDFVGPIYWVLAGGYLWMFKKINPIKGKNVAGKLAAIGISLIAKMIPVVQELPIELLAGMVALIAITYFEDKTGINATTLAEGNVKGAVVDGVRSPSRQSVPMNRNGVRAPGGGLN